MLYFWPTLHYQHILSQEDHGRDLYTFAQIAQGKHLYQDMWWEYGPLMPYYYALFNILFGLKISSVLLGCALVKIFACLFFYLASCEVMAASWAFVGVCFFMQQQQDFFYTYNHFAGIVLFLMLLWLIFKHLHHRDPNLKFWSLAICLVIGFIKINFGFSSLVATLLSFTAIDIYHSRKNKINPNIFSPTFYITGILAVPIVWGLIYYFLVKGLTLNEINQCLPYFGASRTIIATPYQSLSGYWNQNIINFLNDWISFLDAALLGLQTPVQLLNPPTLLLTFIAILKLLIYPLIYGSAITTFYISMTKRFEAKRSEFWLVQLILWIFIILNFHEFIVSNTWYRSFWSQPFILFFLFFMISTASAFAHRRYRYLAGGLCICLCMLIALNEWIATKSSSTPDKFLTAKSGQIYVGNDAAWVNTVNTVTAYLNKNLSQKELFFAIPCDSLYYYLTNKPGPSRQTIFFNSFHIPPQQELSIIRELQKNKVNYVLLSNRIKSGSPELGEFGRTYCPAIYRYIWDNFSPVYRYGGNWKAAAGWMNNHGIILLKRKADIKVN